MTGRGLVSEFMWHIVASNDLKQELLHEIKLYILSLQQDNKTDYMDEYIKAMQEQNGSLKSYISQRGSKTKKDIHWITK